MQPNWLHWSKFLNSSQTWGVLGASVATLMRPQKPEECHGTLLSGVAVLRGHHLLGLKLPKKRWREL